MLTLLYQTLRFMLLGWAVLTNSFLILHFTCPECLAIIIELNNLAHYLLLIDVLCFIVGVVVLKWQVGWLLPGVIVFAFWFGRAFIPNSSKANESFTVVTFNVWEKSNSTEILHAVRSFDADIVGLQEVTAELEALLDDLYPYQASFVSDQDGYALLSRFPILEDAGFMNPFPFSSEPLPNYLRAVIEIEGRAIAVYVFHPPSPKFDGWSYDSHLHDIQVQALIAFLEAEPLPQLLLCDCNAAPRSYPYNMLDEVLDEAFGEVGWGFGLTFPTALPLIRIDYVWYSHHFTPLDAKVWNESATSDHRPVWATLDLE